MVLKGFLDGVAQRSIDWLVVFEEFRRGSPIVLCHIQVLAEILAQIASFATILIVLSVPRAIKMGRRTCELS